MENIVMQPWQQQALTEYTGVADRLAKLIDFMEGETFRKLPEAQKVALQKELTAMIAYRDALGERIKLS